MHFSINIIQGRFPGKSPDRRELRFLLTTGHVGLEFPGLLVSIHTIYWASSWKSCRVLLHDTSSHTWRIICVALKFLAERHLEVHTIWNRAKKTWVVSTAGRKPKVSRRVTLKARHCWVNDGASVALGVIGDLSFISVNWAVAKCTSPDSCTSLGGMRLRQVLSSPYKKLQPVFSLPCGTF